MIKSVGKDQNEAGILLQTGTNELEIVEFNIADSLYGINIAKVREIIKVDIGIVKVPDSHPSIQGAINLRGTIIPVINLAKHLGEDVPVEQKKNRIIVSEFNKMVVGFWVTSVSRIHRISWKEVEQLSDMLQTKGGYAVGVIKIDERVVFLLDFEKISSHINPKVGISMPKKTDYNDFDRNVDRHSKVILVAEDSEFIRNMIVEHLEIAGYKTVIACNGEQAWERLQVSSDGGNIEEHFNLLVTDIEMPQMDGLHLIKKIKDDSVLRKLPCIAFSSMISEELRFKCRSVGADGEIAKPDIGDLVKLVDTKVI
ncbi:MAG: chemotaxis protein CheV [Candidatus Omnitrophota bacterium]|nr:MAG: chemotaxis protein CheV [Candidatus Omnitrophota bacterium]